MNTPIIYQIRLRGVLDERWSGWFSGLAIQVESTEPPITRLTLVEPDQSRLRGILNKAWDLNLTLLSVIIQGDKTAQDGETITGEQL